MKTVKIRNVPDSVYRTLRERAAQAGTSLSDCVLGELVRLAESPLVVDVLAGASARHGGASTEDIVEAVRRGRDERLAD